MLSVYLVTSLLLGSAWAQNGVADKVDQLNSTIVNNQDKINEATNIGLEAFKKKCIENNASETYNKTLEARQTLETCVKTHVNMTEVEAEMKEARPDGRLDEVFKKYCGRKDVLRKCLEDFTDTTKPCLKVHEQENMKIVHNITKQLAEFVCHKDGDRIALFIAEQGPECLQSKNDEIQQCVQTFMGYSDENPAATNITVENVLQVELDFSDNRCRNMEELQKCVVKKLVTCEQPTPSNIAEALFKYVIKATPCGDPSRRSTAQATTPTSLAAALNSALATLAATLATLALL